MPKGKAGKRLVKLRGTEKYRYLGTDLTRLNRREGEGVKWASCATKDSIKFPNSREPGLRNNGGLYVGNLFTYVTVGFASFVFLPLSAGGAVLGYAGSAATGITTVVSTGTLGQAGLFATGLLSTLGFLNPQIQSAAGANFSKPCDENRNLY